MLCAFRHVDFHTWQLHRMEDVEVLVRCPKKASASVGESSCVSALDMSDRLIGLRYRGFALAPAFLRQDEIEERGGDRRPACRCLWPTWEAIAAAAKHSSVKEINDRKGYLAFKHRREKKKHPLASPKPKGSRDFFLAGSGVSSSSSAPSTLSFMRFDFTKCQCAHARGARRKIGLSPFELPRPG